MTTNDAIDLLKEKFPNREVKAVRHGDGVFVITAPQKGLHTDFSNPFFIIDEDRNIVSFSPADDFSMYHRLMKLPIVYGG